MLNQPIVLKRLRKGIRLCGYVVAAVAVMELSLRMSLGLGTSVLEHNQGTARSTHPVFQTVRFGNSVQVIQSSGNRREFDPLPRTDTTRILLVGDCVSSCGTPLPPEQSIAAQLRMLLEHTAHSSIEVLNASANSWGLANQWTYLERSGTFGSHWVVLQLGSHDLVRKKDAPGSAVAHPQSVDRPLFAVAEAWARYGNPHTRAAEPGIAGELTPAERFGRNMDYLYRILTVALEAGARPVILHTPERAEISDAGATNYAPWRSEFLAFAREEQIPVVDLFSIWKNEPQAPSYYRDHVHLNEEGNAAIARHLAIFLQRCDTPKSPDSLHGGTLARIARRADSGHKLKD